MTYLRCTGRTTRAAWHGLALALALAVIGGCGPSQKRVDKPGPRKEPAVEGDIEKKPGDKPVTKPEEKPAPEPKGEAPAPKPKEEPAPEPKEEPAPKPKEEKPSPGPGDKPEMKPAPQEKEAPAPKEDKPAPKEEEAPPPKAEEKPEMKPEEKPAAKEDAPTPQEKEAPAPKEDKPAPTEEDPDAAPPTSARSDAPEGAFRLPDGADPTDVPAVAWLPKPQVEIAEAVAKVEADMKPYTEVIPGTDAKFDMLPIKGGKFLMGSPDEEEGRADDEGPQFEAIVEPFWMGKCEVTWDEYELWGLGLDKQRREVKKIAPTEQDKLADAIAIPTKPYTDMTFGMGKEGYPAACMTQLAAKMYCKWLSAKTGRYYRLPTAAEWEYACRAGTKTAYSFGDDTDKLADFGWYFENSDDQYQKVATKKPNPWGLHDMHGNVAEWVVDRYDPDFYRTLAGKSTLNPYNMPDPAVEFSREVRGGSWDDDPERLRSAARRWSHKDWKMQDPQIPQSIWYLTDASFVGFRVVRPLKLPTQEEAVKFDPELDVLKEYREAQANKM